MLKLFIIDMNVDLKLVYGFNVFLVKLGIKIILRILFYLKWLGIVIFFLKGNIEVF